MMVDLDFLLLTLSFSPQFGLVSRNYCDWAQNASTERKIRETHLKLSGKGTDKILVYGHTNRLREVGSNIFNC